MSYEPKQKNDTEFRTGLVRLSYPKIHKPEQKKDQNGNGITDAAGNPEMQYSLALIIPKSEKATVDMLKKCLTNAAKAGFGAKVPPNAFKGLRDGDTDPSAMVDATDESKGRKPELEGCYWINCTSKIKPRVVGLEKDDFTGKLQELDETQIKAGDWVRVQLRCYHFDKGVNKGIAFGFAGVQLLEEGEPLASGGFDESLFDEETEEAFG